MRRCQALVTERFVSTDRSTEHSLLPNHKVRGIESITRRTGKSWIPVLAPSLIIHCDLKQII